MSDENTIENEALFKEDVSLDIQKNEDLLQKSYRKLEEAKKAEKDLELRAEALQEFKTLYNDFKDHEALGVVFEDLENSRKNNKITHFEAREKAESYVLTHLLNNADPRVKKINPKSYAEFKNAVAVFKDQDEALEKTLNKSDLNKDLDDKTLPLEERFSLKLNSYLKNSKEKVWSY